MVLDGGLATELDRRGYDLRGSLWSARAALDAPDILEAVHLDYLDAGAECITTASYQISAEGFAEAGYQAQDAWRAVEQSVAIAKRARESFRRRSSRSVIVAASLGPYGSILHDGSEYHGQYVLAQSELREFHLRRLRHLVDSRPDLIAFETIPSLVEATAMAEALAAFPHMRAWFAFACSDDWHTVSGDPVIDCVVALERCDQAVAVGVNCTPPHLISALVREMRPRTRKQMVVYPNSGEVWDATARAWRGDAAAVEFGPLAREWSALGADWIGGCCRTTPEDIRHIATALGRDDTRGK